MSEGDVEAEAPPLVKYWDESMIDEAAKQDLNDCRDWPLTVSMSAGGIGTPLNILSELWQENDQLWISPGGPFAQPTRHYFECHRERLGIWAAWDTGEFVFRCRGGSFTIGVRRTHPPEIDNPWSRPLCGDFPLSAKYAAAAPRCTRFIVTVMTPDGDTFEFPYQYNGAHGLNKYPTCDPGCWNASAHHMSPARDEQLHPEGGECVVPTQ